MKITKLYSLFVLILLFATINCSAQKKKKTTSSLPAITLEQALNQYKFTQAEQLLSSRILQLRKSKLDPTADETQLRAIQRAKSKMSVTEQVIFFDSVVCAKSDLTRYLLQNDEMGRVDSYQHFFNKKDTTNCYIYETQCEDQLTYALPDTAGLPHLFQSTRLGQDWTSPTSLSTKGLGEHGDLAQNYPFILADGTTLYYAATGEESLGGYDIFMTRYDHDEKHYLAPENIGMPFNSLANDYLYIIDETNKLGCFVSDRRQPTDSVCVYYFIPNNTRHIYDAATISSDSLSLFARIESISDTWTNGTLVNEARQHLKQVREKSAHVNSDIAKNEDITIENFDFVINDQMTYHSINDFHIVEARKQIEYWVEGQRDLKTITGELNYQREQYTSASATTRSTLTGKINTLESQQRQLRNTLKKQEKTIRDLESKGL